MVVSGKNHFRESIIDFASRRTRFTPGPTILRRLLPREYDSLAATVLSLYLNSNPARPILGWREDLRIVVSIRLCIVDDNRFMRSLMSVPESISCICANTQSEPITASYKISADRFDWF